MSADAVPDCTGRARALPPPWPRAPHSLGRDDSPEGVPFRVTASIGVASAHGPDETGAQLMQSADEALYEAKDSGRNRVVVAS